MVMTIESSNLPTYLLTEFYAISIWSLDNHNLYNLHYCKLLHKKILP